MARFSWETKNLLDRLKKVEKLISSETDEVELAKLYRYYDAINSTIFDTFIYPNVHIPLSKRMPNMFSNYLGTQRYYNLYVPYEDAIAFNAELFDQADDKRFEVRDQIEKACGVHVSKSKAISICHDFYQNLDEELYEHFKRFYNQRFNHLKFLSKDADPGFLGRQHFLFGPNESFIESVGSNNPEMSTTLIHEAAHAIDNSMNPENYFSNDFYYEVISLFMELVSFYKKAGNFDELFYSDSIMHGLNLYNEYMSDANRFGNLMAEYKDNKYRISPEFYESIRNKYKIPRKEVNSFLNEHNPNDICYPISFTLALAFFNIYRQDEKKGIENIKRFIRTVDRDDYIPLVLSNEFSQMVDSEVKALLAESKDCFERHAK